jgi:hypothetical protein
VKFWEDHWFGTSTLAMQYWEIIVNEKSATIVDLWDGEELKVTFRRCFTFSILLQWYEILQIAQTFISVERRMLLSENTSQKVFIVSVPCMQPSSLGVFCAVWKITVPLRFTSFSG